MFFVKHPGLPHLPLILVYVYLPTLSPPIMFFVKHSRLLRICALQIIIIIFIIIFKPKAVKLFKASWCNTF